MGLTFGEELSSQSICQRARRGCSLFTSNHTARLTMASPRQSYSVLAKREVARAAEWNNHASPYCAIRSKTHSACNRYSDILAYDRTAVRTKDGGYLNANVVRDHKGRWWVAAQVSHTSFGVLMGRPRHQLHSMRSSLPSSTGRHRLIR